jgi:hypothetical protein
MSGLGFLLITNIKGFDEDAVFKASKEFHSLPEAQKHTLKWKNHNP